MKAGSRKWQELVPIMYVMGFIAAWNNRYSNIKVSWSWWQEREIVRTPKSERAREERVTWIQEKSLLWEELTQVKDVPAWGNLTEEDLKRIHIQMSFSSWPHISAEGRESWHRTRQPLAAPNREENNGKWASRAHRRYPAFLALEV